MKRNISILILCLVVAVAASGIAGGIIENIKVASQTELFVQGERVDTDLLSATVNGQEVFYVSVEDIAKIYGHQVEINDGAVSVVSGKVGFEDILPDGSSFKGNLLANGIDVEKLRENGAFQDIDELFELVDFPPGVWAVLIAEDYKGWLDGNNALFETLWSLALPVQ